MKERFYKIDWEEEGILFFLEFQGENAVRQIEKRVDKTLYTCIERPISEDSMLYDQELKDLEIGEYISRDEFFSLWKCNK